MLFGDAVIAVAHWICDTRAKDKKEWISAQEFLDGIDVEKMISMAMLADAGDEAGGLVRFFDTDEFDIAAAPAEISSFLQRSDALFLQRQALKCGYTQYMVSHLRSTVRLCRLSNGEIRSVGGTSSVTDEILDRCFARMAAWVRLVAQTIQSEFPQWELIRAFGCLDLSPRPSQEVIEKSLEQLAQCFKLNLASLQGEFEDFQAFAVKCRKLQADTTNLQCWTQSYLKVACRESRRGSHPCSSLGQLLSRYAAFCGASSSCVERSFASAVATEGASRGRNRLSLHRLVGELKLKHEVRAGSEDRLIASAQKIWADMFGASRLSGAGRSPRWVAGKSVMAGRASNAKLSEREWLRRRRTAVAKLREEVGPRDLKAIEADAVKKGKRVWTDTHARELERLKKGEKHRMMLAHHYGQLRPQEVPDQDSWDDHVKRQTANDHIERVRHAKVARQVGATVPKLSDLRCYIEVSEPAKVSAVKKALGQAGGQHVASLALANATVVSNPASLGQRLSWHCALRGLFVLSVDCLVRGQGSHIQVFRQISQPRSVWISASFKASHPLLAEIVLSSARAQGSKWRVLDAREDFERLCTKLRNDRRFQAIGLLTVKEWKADRRDNMFNITTFFERFWKVEAQTFDAFRS